MSSRRTIRTSASSSWRSWTWSAALCPASAGAIAGINSEYHVRDGVECTTKDFDALFTYTSGTQVRTALVENVYAKSDVLLNRLIDYATPFTGKTEPASTYSDKVYAIRTENRGQSFADFLNSHVKENTFDLRMGTTATELIVEEGKVAGVVAEDDEQRYDIRARRSSWPPAASAAIPN